MRQRRGAVLCTSCRQLISVEEKKCPHCGALAPGLFGFGPWLGRFFRDQMVVSEWLTVVMVLLYAMSVALDPVAALSLDNLLNFGAPTSRSLYLLGMTGGLAWAHGLYWTVFSAVFLHGSLLHLVFNVSWVRSLAPSLVDVMGPARTWVLFVLSGVGGFLLSNVASGSPTIGASGGIFGLFGGLWVWGRKRGGTVGRVMSSEALSWAVGGFVISMFMGRVNHYGHLGGLITGALVAWTFPVRGPSHERRGIQILALVLLILSVVSVFATPLQIVPVLNDQESP